MTDKIDDRNKTWIEMMIQIKVFEICNFIEKTNLTKDQILLLSEKILKKERMELNG
jgi:hypothetical protein